MSTLTQVPWKVMADPKDAGRHPYHDHRWIATADAETEMSIDGRDWHLTKGSLIAMMRDVDPAVAHLAAAAPDMRDLLMKHLRRLEYLGYAELKEALSPAGYSLYLETKNLLESCPAPTSPASATT